MVSVPLMNPRRLRWGDQRALRYINIYSEKSKDKIFCINNIATGLIQDEWHLLQVDMNQSGSVSMSEYVVQHFHWYSRHHKD